MTKKHQRYVEKLKAQKLPCRDCDGVAYALWWSPMESGRGQDFFGLCKTCEMVFTNECDERVRNAQLGAKP